MNENKLTKEELQKILVDVRKSYRLLYEYQRRIQDIVKYIANKYGYTNNPDGYTWFSGVLAKKNFDLKRWAWDGLGMYMFDFHFKMKEVKDQKLTFSIIIQADTGYFDAVYNDKEIHRTSVDKFEPAETSKTRLIFLISSKGWEHDKLFGDKKNEHNFSKDKDRWELQIEEATQLAIAYNLERFINQGETDKVLSEFKDECRKFGINILEED